jgi:iron complex outermembrane recepter protein
MKNGKSELLRRVAAVSVLVFCAEAAAQEGSTRESSAQAGSAQLSSAQEGGAQESSAQESSDSSQIAEVLVTAQKREQNVQKVAASVSVIDAATLEARGVVDLRGLTNFLPMGQLNQEGSATQIFIRGIGQTSDVDTNSPAVAVNLDGIYTPRFTLANSLFDVSQVEVLSGPQGTLYGRNAAGGAVNVTTKLPSDHFENVGFLEIGDYSFKHIFNALNVPVSSGFKLRLAVDHNSHDGYLTNGQDDQDTTAARLVALYQPQEQLSVILRGEYQYAGGNGSSSILAPLLDPENPWYQPQVPGEHFFNKETVWKVGAEIKYDLGGPQNITLTYLPAWIDYWFKFNIPIGQPVQYYPNPGVPGNPLAGFYATLDVHDTGRQLTNEFRVNGGDQKLKWIFGLYQLYLGVSNPGIASFNVGNPTVFSGGPAQPYVFATGGGETYQVVTNRAYAAFGEVTYSILDNLRLTGGLRYSDNNDDTHGITQEHIPVAGIALPPSAYSLALSDHRVDWKAGVEFDLDPTSMAYATVQTGFNDGGFNIDAASSSASTFRPMTLLAYTAGIKNRFLDGKLQLNAEGFYYDYKNLQVSAFNVATGGSDQYNVPKSEIYGLQLDTIFRIFPHTTFDANVGLLHGVITSGVLPPIAVYSCGVPGAIPAELCSPNSLIDYKGNSLPNTPAVSGSLGLTQQWNLGNGGFVEGRVATHYESSTWAFFAHLQGLDKPAYTKTDLSVAYHLPRDGWSIGLWVKNVENTATRVTPATTNVYGLNTWFIDAPRTYGVKLDYRFD